MKLSELLKAIQPVQIIGSTEKDITGVNIDSRLVAAGHLFMAMRGTQTDGHAYIPTAIEKGAIAVLCEDMPEETNPDVTYIQVKDSENAVGKVATTFYGDPTSKMELVGVTGTNGKTTIATLLYNTFRYFGYKVGLISTVCNYIDDRPVPTEHTTPDPITLNRLLGEMADSGCKYAFMEVSSHSIAQQRISGLKFAGGIFTNLTEDHLDFHKTMDACEAGDNTGLLLRGLGRDDVERGQVVAKPGSVTPHTKFEGEVYVLTKDEGGRHSPFFSNYRPQFYFRTTDVTGVIELPEGVEMVQPGDHATFTVELIQPIAMEEGLTFAVREGGHTVGSGRVTKILA